MQEKVEYGNTTLSFTINRKLRKTLAIEVYPDLSINVVAPINIELQDIRDKVLNRAKWVKKQQSFFEQFLPRTPKREYVIGESHFYLGKKYVLKIRSAEKNEVKLKGGELVVLSTDKGDKFLTKRLVNEWYYKHAKKRFDKCVQESVLKFNKYNITEKPPLVIKRMTRRWGSCTPKGKIILNPEIIKTHSNCIKYVIIHELCHLIHPNHSKEFYNLQTEIMPDWEKWKMKLEKTLV